MLRPRNIIITLIILGIISGSIFLVKKNGKYDTQEIILQDFTRIIEISGLVEPTQDVDLSFEVPGKVSRIYASVGDVLQKGDPIVELNDSEISAEFRKAQADLKIAQQTLGELEDSENVTDDLTQLDTTRQQMFTLLEESFIVADDAVRNKVDQFYDDPDGATPKIIVANDQYYLRKELNDQRKDIQVLLTDWATFVNALTLETYTRGDITKTQENLETIRDFLNKVALSVNDFEATNAVSQDRVDKYKTDVSSARTALNTVIDEILTASEDLRDIGAEATIQSSRVVSGEAEVDRLLSQISKYVIRAPFDGVLSFLDVEVGENISTEKRVATVISENAVEVEVYIPEINIISVTVGDRAKITLDALPDQEFDAYVVSIEPQSTEQDGIPTYKTLLAFENADKRMLPGMSADVRIFTLNESNVITVPLYALMFENEDAYIYVYNTEKEKEKRKIEIGERNLRGDIKVTKGLSVGEYIILNNQTE